MVAMRKKILTSLLLIFIVSALLFSTVKIEPAKAAPSNFYSGLETGNTSEWDHSYGTPVVAGTYKLNGSYGLQCQISGGGSGDYVDDEIPSYSGKNTYNITYWFQLKSSLALYDGMSIFDMRTDYSQCPIQNNLEQNTSGLFLVCWASMTEQTSYSLSLNVWHKVDIYIVVNGSTYYSFDSGSQTVLPSFTDDQGTLRLNEFGCVWMGSGSSALELWFDDFNITADTVALPPSECLVEFDSEPSGLFSVHFGAGGSWYWTPKDLNLTSGLQTFLIESGSLIRIVSSTLIYGFDHWSITNTTGTFNSTGSSVDYNLQENSSVIMAYTTIRIQVTASPVLPVYFSSEYYGSNYSAPQTLNWNSGSHIFTALNPTYSTNSSYLYTFDHWLVNGTDQYGSLGITLTFTADTNLTIVYVGSTVTPSYPYTYVSGALNATWYFRSDTWTVHSILGYKLQTVNTATPAFDERIDAATKNVSYGVRVWALDLFGNQYELTSGSPAAVATKITEGSEMMLAYWTCPAYSSMIDSIKINLYQQFNDEGWSLRRIYVTGSDLLIRLPSASWTFHYYVNRTVGSTYSTFGFGSYTTYNSRIDLQYYKASPWDVALARLWQRNFVGFLFTPWTYWFGDLFWSIILFGCIIMAWMRTGSFKPVLALLWIIGGSGSILWALIPATALHIAVLMLALAMAITLFRLIYGRRT